MLNVIMAKFCSGSTQTWTDEAYQWDYGQVLQFDGLDLPEAYQVHFSNTPLTGETITQIGNADGVTVPDQYFTTGETIYAWVYLHEGEDDGETVYMVTIPVKKRPQPSDDVPTPVEQSAIDQAIAALNIAVEKAEDAIEHYPTIIDGTWHVWDVTEEEYVDTGVQAQGQDGQPGRDGADGQDGQDGFSPKITVTDITGGHRVTITDAQGQHTFDVMDGEPGEPGTTGNGIAFVTKTGTSGLVDTYTITYTNGQTTTFTVTNGSNATVIVDDALSSTSTNPVQNKVITEELNSTKADLSEFPPIKNSDATGVDLDVSDEDGNVILRLEDGHIQTKNFDSHNATGDVRATSTAEQEADFDFVDELGNSILRLKNGHIQTKNFDSEFSVSEKQFGVVENNTFETATVGWTYDNCTANNGVDLQTESKAYCAKNYTNDEWYLRGVFEINTLGSVFGLAMESNDKGAVYLVDSNAGTITLRGQYTGSYTPPAVIATQSIGFELATGTRYVLEVFKEGYAHTFTITDEQTQDSASVYFDNAPQPNSNYYCGKGHGSPGVICVSGSVTASNVVYSVRNYPNARALFIGDSITEGTNIRSDIKNRWCSLTANRLYNGDVFIMGSGGDTSSGVKTRLQTAFNSGFKADIVIVLVGTNERYDDGRITTWSSNIEAIVDLIEAQSATPVICVPPLAETRNQSIFNMRDFILSKGYQTIRFDYATSVDRDGVTFDQDCFTDNAHPNAVGSYRMYQQAVADIHAL